MSILIMILLLSLLILVHEAGHFCAARAFGIKVEKFGFGLPIGPTLYSKKVGDVEILIHAFLLGGYVAFPDDDKDCNLPSDSQERFINKPVWQRAVVVSAGVIANVICALALVMVVAMFSKQLPSGNFEIYVNTINTQNNKSLLKSGLTSGDRIISANECKINNLYSFITIIKNSAKGNGIITKETVEKNYQLLKGLNPGLEKDEIIPKDLSVRLPQNPSKDIVTMDKYAAKGAKSFKKEGFKIDNRLIDLQKAIAGKSCYISNEKYTLYDLAQVISDGKHPVNLVVLRDGKMIKLKSIYPDKNGLIGIGLTAKQTMIETNNVGSIIKESNKYLWTNTYTMIYSLGQLFTGNIPLKDMHGVVAITKIGGDMIDKSGKASGILLTALISMNLAILNILPIPALDGGHLMFLICEKIFGKPVSEKIVDKISSIFFLLLVVLMILVLFNDITLLVHK